MKPFRRCPACGSPLDEPGSAGAQCASCGRYWYRNPAPTVSAVIVRDGKALVVRRAIEPGKGLYDTPGGFVEVGEDVLDALRREVREELGVEIDVSESDLLLGVAHTYGDEEDWLLSFGFEARLVSGEPSPCDDIDEAIWVTPDELEALDFAWEHNREQTRRGLAQENR